MFELLLLVASILPELPPPTPYIAKAPPSTKVVRIVILPSKMVEWPKGSGKWWHPYGSGWLVYRDGEWKPYQAKTVTRPSPQSRRSPVSKPTVVRPRVIRRNNGRYL